MSFAALLLVNRALCLFAPHLLFFGASTEPSPFDLRKPKNGWFLRMVERSWSQALDLAIQLTTTPLDCCTKNSVVQWHAFSLFFFGGCPTRNGLPPEGFPFFSRVTEQLRKETQHPRLPGKRSARGRLCAQADPERRRWGQVAQ